MDRRPFALAIVLIGFATLPQLAAADLLIENVGTDSILRYNEAANTLTTFVSSGSGGLNVPQGMTYGPDGNLYVSSLGTGSILEYNGQTGAFLGTFVAHTVGSQTLQYPNGIAFDPNNSRYLYIASYYDNEIERYDTVTQTLSVYATLPATKNTAIHTEGPTGLVFGPDGNLYVNESTQANGSQIREYNVSAGDTTGHSIVSGFSDSITHLNAPAQLSFAPSNSTGPLLIDTGFYNNTVNSYQLSTQNGQVAGSWLHQLAGVSPGGLNEPGGVTYDPTTGRVIIANYLGNTLVSANLNGTSDVTTLDPTSIGGAVLDNPTYVIAIPSTGLGQPSPAPEPASVALFGVGALIYLGARYRRRRAA